MTRRLRLALAALLAAPVAACAHAGPGLRSFDDVEHGYPGERTLWGPRSELSLRIAELPAAGPGTAAPVVLLHPWGFDMGLWARVAPALAADRRVLLLDLPGHGKSDKRRTALPMARMAAAVVDALDAAGIARATLVGNSMGGATALAVAQHAPERVAGLALIGAPGGRPFPEPLLRLVRQVAYPRPLETLSDAAWAVGLHVASLGGSPHARELEARFVRLKTAAEWPAWSRATLVVLREVATFEPALEAMRVPALVVHGEGDPLIARGQSEALAARIPGARLVTLPGCGHLPAVECPDALLGALRPFLASPAP
jgi:pimeloyl-ACP methyl ester carboxylesterase